MKFKISGHEKFSLRYPWLPRAVETIKKDPVLFLYDNDAMVEMGVGKNMVKSIRYWTMACDVVYIPKRLDFAKSQLK